MNKERVNSYLKSISNDFKSIRFSEKNDEIELRIGNFFMSRKVDGDYEYAVKKLMEDFITDTSSYHIRQFWEL